MLGELEGGQEVGHAVLDSPAPVELDAEVASPDALMPVTLVIGVQVEGMPDSEVSVTSEDDVKGLTSALPPRACERSNVNDEAL